MKVACVTSYKSSTGYSSAAVATMEAMDAAGIQVVPCDFELAPQKVPLPPRMVDIEKRAGDLQNVDVTLQITLPHLFAYRAGSLNVGYFFTETESYRGSNWPKYINLLDRCWVACEQNLKAARDSGVTIPIDIVPIPCDIDWVRAESTNKLNLNIGNKFMFLAVADYSERKGVKNIIKAYLQEFKAADNVVLVLKTYVDNTSSQGSLAQIQNDIKQIKISIKNGDNSNFPPIVLITNYLDSEQILSLQQQCHCYLNCETGQAWSIPTFNSAVLGKRIIVPNYGGQLDYCAKYSNKVVVDGHMEACYGYDNCPFPLYLGSERWFRPNMENFKAAMRKSYEEREILSNNDSLNEYDLLPMGNKIKKILEDSLNAK